MERNPNEGLGSTTPGTGSTPTPGSYGSSATTSGTTGQTGSTGMPPSTGTPPSTGEQAKQRFQDAKDKANEKLGQAREKAHDLRLSLADKLDQGADKLRARAQTGSYAGATSDGNVGIEQDRMQKVSASVADGLHNSAEWIRNNDLDAMKSGVERQVRENPGKSLLIALGVGYILGKALRR